MDRSWMYGRRDTSEFFIGANGFIKAAVTHQKQHGHKGILCPCLKCRNLRRESDTNVILQHLFERGFRENYIIWTLHGETFQDGENVVPRAAASNLKRKAPDTTTNLNWNNENSGDDDFNDDHMDEFLKDVHDNFEQKPKSYESMVDAARIPLYSTSTFTKLSAVLKLFHLKAKHGWSNVSFTELLTLIQEMLPEGNTLPDTTYKARKLLCPMGAEWEKFHACPNDCVLYRNEYENLDECPTCHLSRYKAKRSTNSASDTEFSKIPAKVLWYLPIIPRFKRLFMNAKDSKHLVWHSQGRKKDEYLRHVSDSPQWRQIDLKYPEFGREDRNLRLGLCTDGMNPYGTLSSQHSTWPVLLVIYNLPSWLCMKRKYIMLSLLISGPKQPGNDIDVYLAPLIDDLKLLWTEGVTTYDMHTKSYFQMRAMLYCTINDFPAYGNLSGYTVKGAKACPICEDDTVDLRLPHCKKNVYLNHRRFLPRTHRYRALKKAFNGKTEHEVARPPLNGHDVYDRVKDLNTIFGKPYKRNKQSLWKKKSIFWELPYWKDLSVRHCLDLMHIEKNVCDSIISTILNVPGKSKDGINIRKDMVEHLNIRKELAPQPRENGFFLPPGSYTLSKAEKKSFCECLHGIKVPSGYASNIRNLVSLQDMKLIGLKSHDYHVLMQHLLPVALRGLLPDHVRHAIMRLSFFFNSICQKVIHPEKLDALQSEVVVTLCQLEMYFPPSLFDIMVHLVVHLVREVKMCGPVFLRYMYGMERHMGYLKSKVKNRCRPEGSIIRGLIDEEVIEFCTPYLTNVESLGVPKSRHDDRLEGKGTLGKKQVKNVDNDLLGKAHLLVLHHLEVVHPYVQQHMNVLRSQFPLKSEIWLTKEHNRTFASWFRDLIFNDTDNVYYDVDDDIKWLAYGPKRPIDSFEAYDINGYTFYTTRQDEKSVLQNSGVSVIASSTEYASANDQNPLNARLSYYGKIEDIWELNYTARSFAIFKCQWVDIRRGVQCDDTGVTLVDFNRSGHRGDPFILASQAEQVFYVKDPSNERWSICLPGKKKITCNFEDEEDDYVEEMPSLSIGMRETNIRYDHNEDDLPFIAHHNDGIEVLTEKAK